jgi:hypothetical protein
VVRHCVSTSTWADQQTSTHGTIHISYAHLAHQAPAPEVFYLRQVSYPLTVTVYHMLECCNMEILPFPSYAATVHKAGHPREGVTKGLVVDQSSGWCLFSIEVRNTYGLSFDVKFERIKDGVCDLSNHTRIFTQSLAKGATVASIFATISPGSMSRYIIRFIQVDSIENVQGLRYLSTKLCSMKNNFHVQYLPYLIGSSSSQKPAFLKLKIERSESFSGTEKNYLNPYVVIGKR